MQYLIFGMILLGSGLMVYNIIRYASFVKRSLKLDQTTKTNGVIIVPLLLLVFFLVGYVIVGISGIADVLMASILLGGSIFVFLLLIVMFSIIERIRDTEDVLASRYDEIRQEIDSLTKDSNSVLRINLTRDEVEERHGDYLYESDLENDRYTDLIGARFAYCVNQQEVSENRTLFTRDGLLQHYYDGQTYATERLLVRRRDGVVGFIDIEATLTKKPVSGDVVAFIVERPCNDNVVKDVLLKRVLMDLYDRIAYIVDGQYTVLVSNAGKKEGLLIKDNEADTYESIYLNCFLPAMAKDARPGSGEKNPLRLSVIEDQLFQNGTYDVVLPFEIDGKRYYKQFNFYLIDRAARFYLMLLSDATTADSVEKVPVPEAKKEEPLAKQAETETLEVLPEAEPVPDEEPSRPFRLLVADDNEINRELANLILTSDGHDVVLAENGKEAVEAVETNEPGRFDAVLMDVNMPVMDGYQATQAIRALSDPKKSRIPIVAMTANAFLEDEKEALDAGMNGFTSKPIDPRAVYRILNKLVEEK